MSDDPLTHPAKFSEPILNAIKELIEPDWLILDPFAGVGGIHTITDNAIGIEIEPEWANAHPRTMLGSALDLPFPCEHFDAIVTSPVYGNRMSDSHDARDGSKRFTYTHTLGRKLHQDNAGHMQWGRNYRAFHLRAWTEARRVLKDRSPFILNISDHIRGGKRIPVTGWHCQTLQSLGFQVEDVIPVVTKRFRRGENYDRRIDAELVIVLR